MTTQNENAISLAEFKLLLDTYGADRTRWPSDMDEPVDALLARNGKAREHLSETIALDSILEAAPQVSQVREDALASRIVAAAMLEPQAGTSNAGASAKESTETNSIDDEAVADSNVIAWPGKRRREVLESSPVPPANVQPNNGAPRDGWRSVALLAASLVLGIYIGFANAGSTTVQDMLVTAGLMNDAGSSSAALDQFYLSDTDEEAL